MSLRLVHSEPVEEARVIDPTVPRVILGDEANIVPWVERQLGLPLGHFSNAIAIGIVIGDRPVAGVLLTNYTKHRETGLVTIEEVTAATDPRWCTRAVLHFLFHYIFCRLKVVRLQAVCDRKNMHARKINERLKFRMEGVGRRAWDGRRDAVVFSMIPEQCPWLTDEERSACHR